MTSIQKRKSRKRTTRRPLPPAVQSLVKVVRDGALLQEEYSSPYSGSRVKTGLSDPSWRDKVQSLVDATNPYEMDVFPSKGAINPPISWYWVTRDTRWPPDRYYRTVMTGYPGTVLVAPVVKYTSVSAASEAAISACKLAFLSKVRGITTPWQGGVFLGELKELTALIHGRSSLLFKITKRSNRRMRRALVRNWSWDRIEKLYLEWTYAVAPLIGDVKSYADAIETLFSEPKVTPVVVTIPFDQIPLGGGFELAVWSTWAKTYSYWKAFQSGSVRIVGSVKDELNGPSLVRAQSVLGFNLKDFIPTVYELLPYSFLVDYFTTVGDVVNGFFTDTSSVVYSSQTVRQTIDGFCLTAPVPGWMTVQMSTPIPRAVRLTKLHLKREKPNLSVSIRDIRLSIPSFHQAFNTYVLGIQAMRRF
ncbi:maturation protein [ssRNA phage SRR7976299_1]|uniref:Maturation protein n=1 Tax=ssRNA phage SRR7976299_1 TaxID=2786631 RepID=A0A8S5L0B3_9VIRU|nr:maturation protein [ssRNA phage SRR7976299_1]DAD51073.1 TPA_asm: maturation protein [ssRNA phage SRR7976299_1]